MLHRHGHMNVLTPLCIPKNLHDCCLMDCVPPKASAAFCYNEPPQRPIVIGRVPNVSCRASAVDVVYLKHFATPTVCTQHNQVCETYHQQQRCLTARVHQDVSHGRGTRQMLLLCPAHCAQYACVILGSSVCMGTRRMVSCMSCVLLLEFGFNALMKRRIV